MDTLIHADIFFFVTTIAVIIVAIALTAALVYLCVVLNRVRDIMEEISEETVLVRQDIAQTRDQIRRGGLKLKYIIDFARSIFSLKASRSKRRKE